MADESNERPRTKSVESFLIADRYSSEQLRSIILNGKEPLRFLKASSDWACSQWTPEYLAKQLGNEKTSFRICAKIDSPFYEFTRSKIVMETDCLYVDATLLNYCAWLTGDLASAGELGKFQRAHYWCYADYKYMKDMFQDLPTLRRSLQWGSLGFPEITGDQSTIWIGSDGSSTPCHLDTYGCNLVAQICGKKRWCLFPPSETSKLYPTRFPYEESSVFSQVNIKNPDLSMTPLYKMATKYEVVLEPGDVLLVPRHWWHFVESLEPSISVNTWIPLESDHVDRVCEAITRALVCSMKSSEGESLCNWLNPTESPGSYQDHLEYLQKAVTMVISHEEQISNDSAQEKTSCEISINDLIDCIVSPQIMAAIADQLLQTVKQKRNLKKSDEFNDCSNTVCKPSRGGTSAQKELSQNSCKFLSGTPTQGMMTQNAKRTPTQDDLDCLNSFSEQSPSKKKRP